MSAAGRIGTSLLLLSLTGCSGGTPTAADGFVAQGVWGGDHATLTVSATTASIEFDCAHGTIPAPIGLDGGRFDVTGVFVFEQGGPIRVDDELPQHAARYSGVVDRENMSLRVRLTAPDQDMGTYVLTLGSPGRLLKCL